MNLTGRFLPTVISLVILSSCGSSARHAPAPGSYFRMNHWYTFADAAPNGPHEGIDSVIARGTRFEGKENVLVYERKNEQTIAQRRISYESNGDVSWYVGPDHGSNQPGGWKRFPLSSPDTFVLEKGNNPQGDAVVDTLWFLESKDTTIEGHFWHAIKIKEIVSIAGHAFNDEVLWFDSETGWYLGMDMLPRHPFKPGLPSNGEKLRVVDCKILE